jgi:predicted PhzF superfamily epimerase YddE/YHI9
MQALARETNLSETAFLVPEGDGFHLRWFTPVAEVDLCGHATLASAHVLWEDGHLPPSEPALFRTLSGKLTARLDGEWILLDFPAEAVIEATPPAGLVEALGVTPGWIGRNRLDWLVAVADEQAVRDAAPDFGALKQVETRGVMITALAATGTFPVTPETAVAVDAASSAMPAPASAAPVMTTMGPTKTASAPGSAPVERLSAADFVSRYFAPAFGIDEDPVTGSAHCALAPYWAGRLGRDRLVGLQLSARGGLVRVHHRGDRVELGGQAVTVLRSTLSPAAAASEEGSGAERDSTHRGPAPDERDPGAARGREIAADRGATSSDSDGSHG